MKKIVSLFLIMVLLLFAGCEQKSGKISSGSSRNSSANSSSSAMISSITPTSSLTTTSSRAVSSSNSGASLSKISNPLDLYGATYEQVTNAFGKNHSAPDLVEGSHAIRYNDVYLIHLEYLTDTVSPTDKVIGITLLKPYDIYKGISVGKTIDQMNSNKELKNKLVLEPDYDSGGTLTSGRFKYNNKDICIAIIFDEKKVCSIIKVFFNKQDEVSSFKKI